MPKLNFELAFATLIPEFLFQFLSSALVDKDSITCLDLEDLRDAVKDSKEQSLTGIKEFLSAEESEKREGPESLSKGGKLEAMAEELDAELAMVDDELYHRYTSAEIRYIFGEITDNIETLYPLYKRHTDINLALSVGFKLKSGLESAVVVEFLSVADTPAFLEDVYFIPMKNYMASDDVIARVYLVYEKDKTVQYSAEFAEIAEILSMKTGKDNINEGGHEHGPGCNHVH